jgi:hypothetical protein
MTDDDIPQRLRAAARSISPGELPSGAELRARVRTRRFHRRLGFGASLVVVAAVVTTLAFQLPGGARPQKVTVSQGSASTTSRPTKTATSSPTSSKSTRPVVTTTVPAWAEKCLTPGGSRLPQCLGLTYQQAAKQARGEGDHLFLTGQAGKCGARPSVVVDSPVDIVLGNNRRVVAAECAYRHRMKCGHAARQPASSLEKLVKSTLVLPSAVIRTGATLHATIEIDNRTGHAIHASGCGSPFQVLLTNMSHPGDPAWPLCLREFTIPTGHSSLKVVISASYNSCGAGSGTPRCTSQGLPALPLGRYQATTYESGHTIPIPAPQAVRVIPTSTARRR